jgi:hypothetical protein
MSEAEDDKPAPVPDPMARAGALSETERGTLEVLADRSRWLSFACFGAAGGGLVVSIVSAAGRLDLGLLLYLVPTSIANAAVGLFVRNAALSLNEAAKHKLEDRAPLFGALQLFSKAFVVEIFALGFLILLLLVALVVAASVKRVTDL